MKNKQKIKGLVPQLRFPGFRGDVSALPLKAIADFVSDKISISQISSAQYVSTENLLPDFGGIKPADKLPSVSSATSFKVKDILVSNIRPYLRKVWQANICGGASNDVIVIRPTERISADYLAAILRSDFFIDYVMRTAKGVKMPRGEISMVREFPVPYPTLPEQQRIADCLSSLDDLISAEGRKLEALRAHKKGLMQQLFPREGETVPRLRFPGFEGEWELMSIGDVFTITRGEVLSMKNVEKNPSEHSFYPVYSSQTLNNGLAGFYHKYLFENAITWTTDGANAGTVNFRKGKFFCTNVCGVLLNSQGFANECVASLINLVTKKHVSYVGNPKLMNNVIEKIIIPLPSLPEQQRIADCLSSLDDLIAAQARKVELLKQHKKGLMQQLFPVMGEAGG